MKMLRVFLHIGLALCVEVAFAQTTDSVSRVPDVFTRLTLPTDPVTGKTFDPRNVAWDYPRGAYLRLRQSTVRLLSDDALLRGQDVRLADLVNSWRPEMVRFTIVGATSDKPLGNHRPSITGVRSSADIKLCNRREDCARFTLSRRDDSVTLDFIGSFDLAMNRYPEPQRQSPSPHWRWDRLGTDGLEFANYLRGHDVVIASSSSQTREDCQRTQLDCSMWREGTLVGCRLNCDAARLTADIRDR